jgi:hypothetical protein
MKLQSIRKGFATNSSSSHSIIIGEDELDKQEVIKEYNCYNGKIFFPEDYWECTDYSSIANYLLLAIRNSPPIADLLKTSLIETGRYHKLDMEEFLRKVNESKFSEDFKTILRKSAPILWEVGRSELFPSVSDDELNNWLGEISYVKISDADEVEDLFWTLLLTTERVTGYDD